MRIAILLSALLFSNLIWANMASPYRMSESMGSEPFTSTSVDIVAEELRITLSPDFHFAYYHAKYELKSDSAKKAIPLLFHAPGINGDFKVWINGIETPLTIGTDDDRLIKGRPLEEFRGYFKNPYNWKIINGKQDTGIVVAANTRYFEANLDSGLQTIELKYRAGSSVNTQDWISEYFHEYDLSPVKYWRSFNGLSIILDGSQIDGSVQIDLPPPDSGSVNSTATWHFDDIPESRIKIFTQPSMSVLAKVLTTISPVGLAVIFTLLLGYLHYRWIKWVWTSRPNPSKFAVVALPSILTPIVLLFGFMYSFEMIDQVIGEHAGGYHGYTFFILFLYPVVMPVYWAIMASISVQIRKKI